MTIDAAGLDLLFKEARTHNKWQDKPITDETLHELYDILKYGPTSANSSPARFVFVTTADGNYRFGQVGMDADYQVWAESDGHKSNTKTISNFDNKKQWTIALKIDR